MSVADKRRKTSNLFCDRPSETLLNCDCHLRTGQRVLLAHVRSSQTQLKVRMSNQSASRNHRVSWFAYRNIEIGVLCSDLTKVDQMVFPWNRIAVIEANWQSRLGTASLLGTRAMNRCACSLRRPYKGKRDIFTTDGQLNTGGAKCVVGRLQLLD